MVYDLINMFHCINDVLITNRRKFIIRFILNFISRNKIDWLNVGGFFLFFSLLTGTIRWLEYAGLPAWRRIDRASRPLSLVRIQDQSRSPLLGASPE